MIDVLICDFRFLLKILRVLSYLSCLLWVFLIWCSENNYVKWIILLVNLVFRNSKFKCFKCWVILNHYGRCGACFHLLTLLMQKGFDMLSLIIGPYFFLFGCRRKRNLKNAAHHSFPSFVIFNFSVRYARLLWLNLSKISQRALPVSYATSIGV